MQVVKGKDLGHTKDVAWATDRCEEPEEKGCSKAL